MERNGVVNRHFCKNGLFQEVVPVGASFNDDSRQNGKWTKNEPQNTGNTTQYYSEPAQAPGGQNTSKNL